MEINLPVLPFWRENVDFVPRVHFWGQLAPNQSLGVSGFKQVSMDRDGREYMFEMRESEGEAMTSNYHGPKCFNRRQAASVLLLVHT